MDIIAAYQQVGTYRGAAAMCGTTHKTVKRIIERAEAGGKPPDRRPRERNYDPVARPGRRAGEGHVGPDLGQAAAAGGEGGRVCGVAAELPAAGRRREAGVAARSPPGPAPGGVGAGRGAGDRLGQRRRAACVLRGAGLVAGPVRAVRRQRAGRHHAGAAGRVLRGARRCPEGRARGPDGLPEGRRGREQGGAHRGLRPFRQRTTLSGRTGARRPTRSRRGSWRTSSAMPSATWWSRRPRSPAWPRLTPRPASGARR